MNPLIQLYFQLFAQLYNYLYTKVYIGTHLNDASFSGIFYGQITDEVFTVQIDTTGGTDTFSWTCSNYKGNPQFPSQGNNIAITGQPQLLCNNIYIKFLAITGHTLGDKWTYTIHAQSSVKFTHVWNDQMAEIDQTDPTNYPFELPAAFIEMDNSSIKQMGLGVQIYDPLHITVHYIVVELDSQDGNLEQNFNVLNDAEAIFELLTLYKPSNCINMVRIGELQNYKHDQIYHFTQTYKTNLVNNKAEFPRNTIVKTPVTNLIENRVPAP